MKPNFTPVEAKALFGDDLSQEIFHEGFRINMDGPQASPPSEWAPVAEEADGTLWFVEGDNGDPLEGKDWIAVK